jgi:hypothetical protein
MSAILFPVAANADEALAAPKGRAVRAREAERLAGGAVTFVTELVGPPFATREAALDAYAGRLDDDRPGRGAVVAPEDRYLAIAERLEGGQPPGPVEPAFAEGRRWPAARAAPPATVFRLMVSYWRIAGAAAANAVPDAQAREMRRRAEAARLSAAELRALAQRPLRPVKPQQPLDVGLFESPAPEAPHILIPDE